MSCPSPMNKKPLQHDDDEENDYDDDVPVFMRRQSHAFVHS